MGGWGTSQISWESTLKGPLHIRPRSQGGEVWGQGGLPRFQKALSGCCVEARGPGRTLMWSGEARVGTERREHT